MAVVTFNIVTRAGSFGEVNHGDILAVLGKDIVFADPLCDVDECCEFCEQIRRRILSRQNLGIRHAK